MWLGIKKSIHFHHMKMEALDNNIINLKVLYRII